MFLLIVVLLSFSAISSGDIFFSHYDVEVFTAPVFFSGDLDVPKFQFPWENFAKVNNLNGIKLMELSIREEVIVEVEKEPSQDPRPAEEVPIIIEEKETDEQLSEFVEVSITDKGLEPKIIEIEIGETVLWKNERVRTKAFLVGLRELNAMNSGFLEAGEVFSHKFEKRGKFTYVDNVIIGFTGRVIVGSPSN